MAHFRGRDVSSFEYVDAIPTNHKSHKQKRLWKWIAIGVTALVIIIVVIVVAVVVTNNNKNKSNNTGTSQYPISPYAQMTPIVTNNDTSLIEKQRVFVVGDIHGCLDDFNNLVTKLNFNSATDQLILAGDLTSKGPNSAGVLSRARELGALCVRGNHDDKVVRLKTFQLQKGQNAMYPLDATMPEGNVPDPLKFKNYHSAVAANLTQDNYDYLTSCPVMLHIPYFNNSVVVHGGLDPKITTLQDQIPFMVMTMRDIDKNNQTTSDNNVGIEWAQGWTDYQKMLTVDNTNVYYGHDSSRGLNLKQFSFGVDTGCVYGNELTAINIKTHELTQVKCPTYVKKGTDIDDMK